MQPSDALTLTVLGMGVVFCGLLLTSLVIILLGVVPRLLQRRRQAPQPSSEVATATVSTQPAKGEAVSPEVLSVIAAVLEVERRLYHSEGPGRFTMGRARPDQGGHQG